MKKITEKQLTKQVSQASENLAARLYDMRVNAGLSQTVLASLAGVDRKTINRIENRWFSPSLETIVRIAAVLKVKPEQLVK